MMKESNSATEGFTLVEIVLALFVAAIGLMAIVALFPAGMDANKTANNETAIAIFAEETFGCYRQLVNTLGWDQIDNSMALTNMPPILPSDLFVNAGELYPESGQLFVNEYKVDEGAYEAVDNVFRYELNIKTLAGTGNDIKYMVLRVWPGPGIPATSKDYDAYTFYTEIYRTEMQ